MEYFDNTKPNVIIFTDQTHIIGMQKYLGPYKIASSLRDNGFEVAVINNVSVFTLEEIKHILKNIISKKTLYVGVNNFGYTDLSKSYVRDAGGIELLPIDRGSILPHGKHHNKEIKKFVKTLNPNVKFVLGGQTALDTEQNNDFDYIILGYADVSAVNLANFLLGKENLNKSHKSIFGPVIITDLKAENYEFSTSKVTYKDYDGILAGESLFLEISRGCIFKCSFCSFPLNGKKKFDYIKEPDILYQELVDNYEKFGITTYSFADDTFNDSPEKCKMIYDISKRLPFKLRWWAYMRLDLLKAHPETIEWIFDSGCKAAYFGVETLGKTAANIIGKSGNYDGMFNVVRHIKEKYGNEVSLHGNFIFGLPGESFESMKNTGDFLLSDQCPLDSWSISTLWIRKSTAGVPILSDIDRDYKKYGYKSLGDNVSISNDNVFKVGGFVGPPLLWENEHTNYFEVTNLITEINKKATNKRIFGNAAFKFIGLGLSLDDYLNKEERNMDWGLLDRLKLEKAKEYKKIIFNGLQVPESVNNHMSEFTSFAFWMYDHNRS